jgi:predicted ribosomally synthesized peptide with SipW-like signal peptide
MMLTSSAPSLDEQPARGSRRKRAVVALAAGTAGFALLTGGATFALWSQSATVDGASISSGTLGVSSVGSLSWADTSADVAGGPIAIDLSSFAIVPGDTIVGAQPFTVVLSGHSITASLSAVTSAGDLTGDLAADGLSGRLYLVQGPFDPTSDTVAAAQVLASAPLDGSDPSDATFAFDGPIAGGSQTVTAVVQLTLDSNAQLTGSETATLSGLSLQLTQLRPTSQPG